MKLILCKRCGDVVRLIHVRRECYCGCSSGVYRDQLNAEIEGPAVPIGISNSSLRKAVYNRPESGDGEMFEAFVIPVNCGSVNHGKAT